MGMEWFSNNVGLKLIVAGSIIGGLVVGCGGGGGSSGGSSSSLISGVVASGNPVTSGGGYALNAATGVKTDFSSMAADGKYTVNLTGQAGPFLLHVVGVTSGGSPVNMYSLAAASSFGGTINVTPLSDVVLAYAAGATTLSLESACTSNLAGCPALLNGILTNLSTANTAVVSAIPSTVLSQFGLTAGTFNAITTQFATTHTGVDGLLDAIAVVPAVATGASFYQINLVGATPTTLVTIPTTGTVGTQGSAPTSGTLTATALTQATNLALAQAEVKTFLTNFQNLFATALPTSNQLSPYLDTNFLSWGMTKAQITSLIVAGDALPIGWKFSGGALAPYAGAPLGVATTPGVNLTYDSNNCVTSIWVYFGGNDYFQLKDVIPGTNAAGVCTGGTWTLMGNGRAYSSELIGLYEKVTSGSATTYAATFQLITDAEDTTGNPAAVAPYDSVTITGPGLATAGNPTATSGTVNIIAPPVPVAPAVLQQQNSINDPYYGSAANGTALLKSCAIVLAQGGYTASTPCFNDKAVGDFTIKFYNGATLLETDMQRINVAVSLSSVPTSWYPTITSVTPSHATSIPTGSTVTPVTLTWTLPAGAQADSQGTRLYNNIGTLIFQQEDNISPTATSHTINVSGLTVAPTSGWIGVLAPIGGLKVGSITNF